MTPGECIKLNAFVYPRLGSNAVQARLGHSLNGGAYIVYPICGANGEGSE